MKNTTLYILTFLICLVMPALQAQEMINYEQLSQLPVRQLFQLGEDYHKKSHTDTAMGYYIIIAGKYEPSMTEADKYLCAMACVTAGELYYKKENYSQAFEMYLKGIQICEENNFNKLLPQFYKNIGNIYSVFEDHKLAIEYYSKGLQLARKLQIKNMELRILANITGAYLFDNNLEMARQCYEEMTANPTTDSLTTYYRYFNKAMIEIISQQDSAAIWSLRQAVAFAKQNGLDPQYIASGYGDLATLHMRTGHQDSALYYFHKNEQYTGKHNLLYFNLVTLEALTQMYRKQHKLQEATYYERKHAALADSILNLEKYNKLKNTQILYELDKNYQKISRLTQEKAEKEQQVQRQRQTILLISAGLLAFGIFSLIIYLQKKKLYSAYTSLYLRNNEIAQSEQNLKEQRMHYEEQLAEKETTIQQLIQNQHRPEATDTEYNTSAEMVAPAEENKNNSSKISEEQKENLLRQISHIMEETTAFCDCDFSLERLATLIGSNSRYISQIINDTYHKNFRTYVNEYRIKEARIRLMNTEQYGNLTIKAIGESVGYRSQVSFTEIFKKSTGITPAMYQKLAKQEIQKPETTQIQESDFI